MGARVCGIAAARPRCGGDAGPHARRFWGGERRLFMRAAPGDFDAWPPRWAFPEVLDAYRRSEHDHDFAGRYHGDAGPIPIRRPPASAWTATSAEFVAACTAAGFRLPRGQEPPRHRRRRAGAEQRRRTREPGQRRARLPLATPRTRADPHRHRGARAPRSPAPGWSASAPGPAPVHAVLRGAVRGRDRVRGAAAALGDRLPRRVRALGISVVASAPGVGTFCSDHPEIGARFDVPAPTGPATACRWYSTTTASSSGPTHAVSATSCPAARSSTALWGWR